MLYKFLSLIYTFLCVTLGFGLWYLIIWFFTKQSDLFEWTLFSKIIFFLFGMNASENLRTSQIKITITRKNKDDEQI